MEQFEPKFIDSLHQVLERSSNPDEEWLGCIFCEAFFQVKHLRIDYLGNRQGCAFCSCAGFDCAIFLWDAWREDDHACWPRLVAELCYGLEIEWGAAN